MALGVWQTVRDGLAQILKPAIDAFFTNVMVNVEDAALRSNRLSLLKDVNECFTSFADFSRIMVQGT